MRGSFLSKISRVQIMKGEMAINRMKEPERICWLNTYMAILGVEARIAGLESFFWVNMIKRRPLINFLL